MKTSLGNTFGPFGEFRESDGDQRTLFEADLTENWIMDLETTPKFGLPTGFKNESN